MVTAVNIVVEGNTERNFVQGILRPYLWKNNIYLFSQVVETGRSQGRTIRGGGRHYGRLKQHLLWWMRQTNGRCPYFTTMMDVYALYHDFPGLAQSRDFRDPYQRVAFLESQFSQDINQPRFFPYLQLHEFEALVLAQPEHLNVTYPTHQAAIRRIINDCAGFNSPEQINDGQHTAPSKRIIRQIPDYEDEKSVAGPLIIEHTGLDFIRSRCPHFNAWLTQLEQLGMAGAS